MYFSFQTLYFSCLQAGFVCLYLSYIWIAYVICLLFFHKYIIVIITLLPLYTNFNIHVISRSAYLIILIIVFFFFFFYARKFVGGGWINAVCILGLIFLHFLLYNLLMSLELQGFSRWLFYISLFSGLSGNQCSICAIGGGSLHCLG